MSSIPVIKVAITNLVDLGSVVAISSLLEKTLPGLDETKPVWQTGLEAWGQITAATLLSLELRSLMSGVYFDDPTGGMAFSTLLFILQPKLHTKLNYLKDQATMYVGSMMTQS
jgi:hypothetical protein